MKRKIKFRGLPIKENHRGDIDWKYGNLLNYCSIGMVGSNIDSYSYSEVDPDTIGQFTGFTDYSEIEIFEGDIIKFRKDNEFTSKKGWYIYPIKFWNGRFSCGWDFGHIMDNKYNFRPQVIGNIYENPELLPKSKSSIPNLSRKRPRKNIPNEVKFERYSPAYKK